jgi:uncharacterized membrane protein YphA (DoxX/SURF4 family)
MSVAVQPPSAASKSPARGGRILLLIGRLALAALFLFAGYSKLKPQIPVPWSINSIKTSLSMFAMQVDSYQMLPPSQAIRVAHFLPLFECFLGLWLLSGIAVRFSTLVTTLLLTGFFALIVRTYALGLAINCGCFGSSEQVGPRKMVEDGSFLAFSLAVTIGAFWLHRWRNRGVSPAVEGEMAATSQASR